MLTSCVGSGSGSDIIDQIITQNMIVPVKMVSDGETFNFNYNGMKVTEIVSSSNLGNKSVFNYNEDMISKITTYENNEVSSISTFIYNSGKLATATTQHFNLMGFVSQTKYVYSYSGNNVNVQKTVTSTINNDNYTINNSYSIANGNVVGVNGTGSGTVNGGNSAITQTGTFLYSAKNYAFKNIVGFDKLIFNGDTEDSYSILYNGNQNNLSNYKFVKTYVTGGVTTSLASYYKYTTTYTDKDFPANEVRQSTDANGNPDGSQPNTIVYTYNY